MDIAIGVKNSSKSAEILLQNAGEKAGQVIIEALNRGLAAMGPELSRGIRELYNIKTKDLRSEISQVATTRKAQGVDDTAVLQIGTQSLGLSSFKHTGGRQKGISVKRRKKLSVYVKKSSSKAELDHAFLAVMPSGKTLICERIDPKDPRSKIRALYGPTVKGMAKNEEVVEQVMGRGRDAFEARLESNLNRLFFGTRKL